MPSFKNRIAFEMRRGVRAFLNLEIGLSRSRNPEAGIGPGVPEILEKPGGVDPKNIVWVLGSPRTGSTWLGRMVGELDGHVIWNEPFFGVVLGFRDNIANKGYIDRKNFLLGEPHRKVWIQSMRRLFLDVCRSRFPDLGPEQYLIVKEPNGSISAPLILEAFPESRLVFLIRDGRDVVASLLDAAKDESWYGYERYEASLSEATLQGGRFVFPEHTSEEEFVKQLARNYLNSINAVKEAYESHRGRKTLLKYEDLRLDPLKSINHAYSELGMAADENELVAAVERHAWENVPKENRGEGKFHRKAAPGSWREDLTPKQIEIVEEVISPVLKEFYPR